MPEAQNQAKYDLAEQSPNGRCLISLTGPVWHFDRLDETQFVGQAFILTDLIESGEETPRL